MRKNIEILAIFNTPWEPIAQYEKDKQIVWDLRGIPWVWNISSNFLAILWLRALIRWSEWKEIILPEIPLSIQIQIQKIKENMIEILSLNPENIIEWDYLKHSRPETRLPYIFHRNYFPDIPLNFSEEKKKLLNLVDQLVDKAQFAQILQESELFDYLPDNTATYKKAIWTPNFPEELLNDFKNRFSKKQSFIIKAWLGASWTNMIFFKFNEKDNKYTLQYNWLKLELWPNEVDEALKHLHNAIPEEERKNNSHFLIQDLIDTSRFEEKSISFFITKDNISFVVASENYTDWTVHQWNKQTNLDSQIIEKFLPIVTMLQEMWYESNIWFDFFIWPNNEIKIIEANPRFTAPITPIMLLYKFEKLWYISQWRTFRLDQKCPVSFESLKRNPYLITPKNVANLYQTKWWIFVFGPETNRKTPLIVIGENQQTRDEIYKTLKINQQ